MRVVAMTRAADRAAALEAMGAEPVLGDVFDAEGLRDLVVEGRSRRSSSTS